MRTVPTLIASAIVGAMVSVISACSPPAKAPEPPSVEATAPAPVATDLVQTAGTIGIFSTFSKAVTVADLGATLSAPGPYTIFVPEDSAFAKLPPARLKALLADKAALARLLKYHVVPGRITSADMAQGETDLTAVEGGTIKLKVDSEIRVNGVKVVQSDISASNGVIHVLDTVLAAPAQ